MRRKVFENGELIVEVEEDRCYVTNKFSGTMALLHGSIDGMFQCDVLSERYKPEPV